MERFFHNTMYAARWILAPVYFGLSFALLLLALKFFQEVIHVLPHIFEYTEADLILFVFLGRSICDSVTSTITSSSSLNF